MDSRLSQALATFATGYAKRLLTKRTLDYVFQSDLGTIARGLDTPSKLGIEFALNTMAALAVREGNPTSVLDQIQRNLITDVPSEITERLFHDPPPSDSASTGRTSRNSPGVGNAQDALAALLALDEPSLTELIDWLRDSNEIGRKRVLDAAASLTAAQLRSFAGLDAKSKAAFLETVKGDARTGDIPLVRQLNVRLRRWLARGHLSREGS